MGLPNEKSMCQTICFPGKFTDGEGLGINTCDRARVAKCSLRRAETEVQMQKVTLQVGGTMLFGGKETLATIMGNPRPFQLYGIQSLAPQTEEQTSIFCISDQHLLVYALDGQASSHKCDSCILHRTDLTPSLFSCWVFASMLQCY